MAAKWQDEGHSGETVHQKWNEYVPDHLLPRLYGFELMMAPYAVAHMKIGLKLSETGYRFRSHERARIYLTNALEPPQDFSDRLAFDAPALAHEAQAVNAVKRHRRFTVISGNPPYSAASHNPSRTKQGELTNIGELMQRYFEVEGVPLGERNPRWLQDDYVKFMRFSEACIVSTGVGVLGLITNHGYIANPTFRGMRNSLLSTFSSVRIIDLHGNSKRGERSEDGSADENVFDIQQGVAVGIFCRMSQKRNSGAVYHMDVFGSRGSKYQFLSAAVDSLRYVPIKPVQPFFLFVPQDETLRIEYDAAIVLTDVFVSSSVGVVTARDALTIHFTHAEAKAVVRDFAELPLDKARAKYSLGDDSRDWKVSLAQQDLQANKLRESLFVPILYRPFDVRYTFYTGRSRGFHCMPRGDNMGHMVSGRNLGLITARSNKSPNPDHFFCSRFISEAKAGEATTQSCLFPLYVFAKDSQLHRMGKYQTNFHRTFLAKLHTTLGYRYKIGDDLPEGLTPEDIFQYAYAVFHSPGYRTRYAEFLKIDFPRLPLTSSLDLFRALARLGGELVALHLMESPKLDKPITKIVGKGDAEVAKGHPKYDGEKVHINPARWFSGVPEAVYHFHIGGYQVCEKWLKDRRGRMLTDEDVAHYQKVVVALNETIRLMAEIDGVIEAHGGWPGAFVTDKVPSPEEEPIRPLF